MHSQSKIQHTFQRALTSYNKQAIVQKNSAGTLLDHLIDCGINTSLDRIFEFGCGTGFLTQHLTDRFTIGELIANDLVAECQTYLPLCDLSFITGDVDNILMPSECDLICSASCVQWSADLEKLLHRLTDSLNMGGYLAISSFSDNHFKELAILDFQTNSNSNTNNKLNYWSEQVWRKHLKANYKIELITKEEKCLWFDSVRELLLHLRLTGVNGKAGTAWSKHNLEQFEDNYRQNFEVDGKVPLTYEPIYIVACKKSSKIEAS